MNPSKMNPLKKARAESGMSAEALSKAAKVNETTISKLENNQHKAQLRTLGKLAKALEIDVEVLASLAETGTSERAAKGGAASKGVKKIKRVVPAQEEMINSSGELTAALAGVL